MKQNDDVQKDIQVLCSSLQRLTHAVEQLTLALETRITPTRRRILTTENLMGLLFFVGLLLGVAYLMFSAKH